MLMIGKMVFEQIKWSPLYTIKYNFANVEKWAPAVCLLFEVASSAKIKFSLLIFLKIKKNFQGVKRDFEWAIIGVLG